MEEIKIIEPEHVYSLHKDTYFIFNTDWQIANK